MPWTNQKSCKNFKQFQSSKNYLGFICEAVHFPYNNRCHRVRWITFLCKKLCSIFSTEYFAKLSSRIILRIVSYSKGLFSFISCLCKKRKVSLRTISFSANHSRIPEEVHWTLSMPILEHEKFLIHKKLPTRISKVSKKLSIKGESSLS